MQWTKVSNYRWKSDAGHIIMKYRMTPSSYSFLLYQPGESLDGGDYTSHDKLKDAKDAANAQR